MVSSHPPSAQEAGGAPDADFCSLLCDKLWDHNLWAQQHPRQSAGKEAATSPCPGCNTGGQAHPLPLFLK